MALNPSRRSMVRSVAWSAPAVALGASAPALAASTGTPLVHLTKAELEPADSYEVGQVIEYGFVVSNTGTVSLTDIVIDDPLVGGVLAVTPSMLDPGDVGSTSAVYVVTQADVDRGSVVNRATATGTPPQGGTVSDIDEVTVTFQRAPSLDLTKRADVAGLPAAGTTIAYTLIATNTGNTALANVTLTDAMLDLVEEEVAALLEPGESTVWTGSYVVTEDDVSAGSIHNTASVSAYPPGPGPAVEGQAELTLEPAA